MLPDSVLDLFRRQLGLLADWQLREAERDPAVRRTVRRHPDVTRLTPRVLCHRAAPSSTEQCLMLAVLDGGPSGALWGKSAASHWGLTRYRRIPAHVGIPRTRVRGPRAGQIHLVRSLDELDVTTHLDIPVSRPERTMLWLAGMYTHRFGHEIGFDRAAVSLDQAWRQRLIDGHAIHALAARSGGKGRSGIVILRELLDARPPDYQPAGSHLEERFEQIVPSVVADDLDRQITVDAEFTVRTVDFRLRRWPLVVEINGEAFHTSLTDRTHDDERYARLLELGFSVVVFWEYDIWHDATTVGAAMENLFHHPDVAPALHRPTPAPWSV